MKNSLVALTALLALSPAIAVASPYDDYAAFNLANANIEASAEVTTQEGDLEITTNAQGEVTEMVMLSDVAFEFGSAELSKDAVVVLTAIASKLDGVSGLEIEGHTDNIGGEAENIALGLARAKAVAEWLMKNDYLAESELTLLSAGESNPLVPNVGPDGADDAIARAQNRRVAFHVVDTEQDIENIEQGAVQNAVQDATVVEAPAEPKVENAKEISPS
ncbi:MAG: OmpA family protein [Aliishimia sp.]